MRTDVVRVGPTGRHVQGRWNNIIVSVVEALFDLLLKRLSKIQDADMGYAYRAGGLFHWEADELPCSQAFHQQHTEPERKGGRKS